MPSRLCCPVLLLLLLCSCSTVSVVSGAKDGQRRSSSRRDRFPSVEQRVQIYMSNWYAPPCPDDNNSNRFAYRVLDENNRNEVQVSNLTFSKTIDADMAFWFQQDIVMDCARSAEQYQHDQELNITLPTEPFVNPKVRHNMRMYCADVVELIEILHHLELEQEERDDDDDKTKKEEPPILMQFGDMKHSHVFGLLNLPHIKKFRSATNQLQQVTQESCISSSDTRPALNTTAHGSDTLQPIVWKLATHRHFRLLPQVYRLDTPWHDKLDMAFWRGQLTGALGVYDKEMTPTENCFNLPRCRLVYEANKTALIDAKLTTTRNRLPHTIDGIDLVVTKTGIDHQMQYKGIIMLEGNDVASGLKWSLLSQSVVLMPPPKHTSWAMEELLEPWVHYVPLNDDATDVVEKMEWILDHDQEAQRIAERATLWMEDLVFHPDAARDDRMVKEEIIRRYRTHFVEAA